MVFCGTLRGGSESVLRRKPSSSNLAGEAQRETAQPISGVFGSFVLECAL